MQDIKIIITLCLKLAVEDIKHFQVIMPVGSDTGTRITFLQNKYFQGSVQPVNVLKKYIFFIYWFHEFDSL